MAKPFPLYDLRVTVTEIRGRSVCGMQVGDTFDLTESSKLQIPADRHFCIYALSAVLPLLAAKQRELHENDWMAQDSQVICPDPDEGLVMTITRTERHTLNSEDLT